MKREKLYHCRLSKTGRTYPVTLRFTRYILGQTLCVQLRESNAPWGDFAQLSVNLQSPLQDETRAFLDINNCPWAEEFLRDNQIAHPVEGVSVKSGFCTYPLYEFNTDARWEED